MSSLPHEPVTPVTRRLLLLDLDWQDADRLPGILNQPGVSVRLVAGQSAHDPGLRMAELCDLPRTLDLADLTREIFDVALVGERSPRRAQLETLLSALGTPTMTPDQFLFGAFAPLTNEDPLVAPAPPSWPVPASEPPHASGVDDLIDEALPELAEPVVTAPITKVMPAGPRIRIATLEDFPSPEVRSELEDALKHLVSMTGAGSAELHAGDRHQITLVAQAGPEDRLLRGLIDLANEMGTPQVVTRQSDPGRGLTWAAWPFQTLQRRGVLAGAAIDAEHGLSSWQAMISDLRDTWDREDRERSAVAYPMTPIRPGGWLDPDAFRMRVDLAIERNRHDGLRFELHRLEFPEAHAALVGLSEVLPLQLRDCDALCRPFPQVICLLMAGEPGQFAAVQRRLVQAWEQAWSQAGLHGPTMPFVDRHVALHGPEDRDAVRTAADVWLAER